MTNSVKTKRALLSSVIALILCMSMLIGTTFAWFTDSVASGKNHIVAGNLDVELYYQVNGDWVAVDSTTNIFGDSLWEPGHTEVVTLKVANVGTLALKYQMGVNVWEEKTSINVYGEELKLSDYIEFGIVDGQFNTREQARAAVTTATKLSDGYTVDEVSMMPGAEQVITLVVYMPESVGNEANYMTGYEAPEINLGINLMATQLVHENDSFGPDYDEDATHSAIPAATVTVLSDMPTVPLYNLNSMQATGEVTDLDAAYTFSTTQTYDQAVVNDYAKWHADFVVSFDKPVAANSVGLGGYYKSWCDAHLGGNWLTFAIPENVPANTPVRLLNTAGISMNYEELCLFVKDFSCGIVDLSGKNGGTTVTVQIALYQVEEPSDANGNSWNVETGVSQVFGTYSYTFANPSDLPAATVVEAPAYVNADLAWDSRYNAVATDTKLEAAYTFSANEVDPQNYADWTADFYVSVDQDVAAGELILAGQYGSYGWIGFTTPATAANVQVPLLGTANIHANYEEICNIIQTFHCGVADVSDALSGATITVELRLTNPADPAESYVVSTNYYTFG